MEVMLVSFVILCLTLLIWYRGALPVKRIAPSHTPNAKLLTLSSDLLYQIKVDQATQAIEESLASYTLSDLQRGLPDDVSRKVFWINLYNAFYQLLAQRYPKSKKRIFTRKDIRFADVRFSLDDIEHGILRKYRWKYSLGYWPQFFPSRAIKTLAIGTLDYKIHFALNCGAVSCPPIAFYALDQLDKQLDLATESFLQQDTHIDVERKQLQVSSLMKWFKADFGGTKGCKAILSHYLQTDFSNYTIRYKPYNWQQALKNFT